MRTIAKRISDLEKDAARAQQPPESEFAWLSRKATNAQLHEYLEKSRELPRTDEWLDFVRQWEDGVRNNGERPHVNGRPQGKELK